MAKICFPCALSVFLGEIHLFCNLSLPFSRRFSHLSFHHFTIQDLWGLFFNYYYPFLSSQGRGLHCEFQYPAVQYSCTWGNCIEPSLSAFVIQCSDTAGFWIPEKFVCSLSICMSVSIYVCVSLFFIFKAISKPKTMLGFLCEASYGVRRWSWSLAKTHLKAVGFFLGTGLRLMKCWDCYRSRFLVSFLVICSSTKPRIDTLLRIMYRRPFLKPVEPVGSF